MAYEGIQTLLDEAVAQGVAPGLSGAVFGPDGVRTFAAGARGAADPAPMTPDTVFWIASCTKAITSLAALQLVERGLLSLDGPISDRLPALAEPRVLDGFEADGTPRLRPARRAVTLRDLLTHTSGLAYDFCSADLTAYYAATGENLLSVPPVLAFDPGERWQYGTGIDAAGWAIEAATGQDLQAYFADNILGPLGMTDSTLVPDDAQNARRAGLHMRLPDGGLFPMDAMATPRPLWGGGGLISTPGDYLKFLQAVMSDGAGLVTPASLAMLRDAQADGAPAGDLISSNPAFSNDFLPMPGTEKRWTLGFLRNETDVPHGRRAGSLAWGGIANCYYWADPQSGVAGVLFAQVLPFADARLLATFEAFERATYATG